MMIHILCYNWIMLKNYRKIYFYRFIVLIFLVSFLFSSCSYNSPDVQKGIKSLSSSDRTELGTTETVFLDNAYITESLDFALYDAWIRLDEAMELLETGNQSDTSDNIPDIKYSSNKIQETIATAQNNFLQELEREKNLKTYRIARNMYGIHNQMEDMETACVTLDRQELSRLVTAFYISKGLIYQKSGNIFVQLLVTMGVLILLVMTLLIIYQFVYARRIEIEKILKATNKGQEEERRRLALELHDSVAQQMRYVSILAEKIPDEQLAKEIKTNQSECIENIRNACYTLSSINMDKGNFPATLKNSIDSFQKRTGIQTSLIITPDTDFDSLPQITFHHLFRIIMELLANIEKHSGASEVTVLIRNASVSDKMHHGLVIFVSDDGKGLDSKTMEMMNSKKIASLKTLHFGLQNIKLRLNEIGGSIKYFSEQGEGTEVQIRIGK